jgi:DNA-binding MarR family transcriptional regulator
LAVTPSVAAHSAANPFEPCGEAATLAVGIGFALRMTVTPPVAPWRSKKYSWRSAIEFDSSSNYYGGVARKSPQAPAPLTMEEEAVWRALARAVLVIPRLLDADMFESQGLNITEYNVLMNLSEAPKRSLRMSELANYVAITDSGLTRVLDRLSRRGLVERVRAEDDGRGQVAVLTRAGLARLKKAWPSHLATVRRHIVDHLEGLDLVALAEALTNIASTDLGPPLRRSSPTAR